MSASRQWLARPDDERFWTLDDLLEAAVKKQENSKEGTIKVANLSFAVDEKDPDMGIVVRSHKNTQANISNLAFSQMAARLEYPVSGVVDKLNAKIACDVLNYRRDQVVKNSPEEEVLLLIERGTEGVTIRSVNSERYARVYDAEIIPFAQKLEKAGWKIPPARPNSTYKGETRIATANDIVAFGRGGLQVKVGDKIAPSGLYMGDRDMFIFMVNDKDAVDDGGGNALMKGVFVCNSEVGTKNFSITEFICQGVCGNHIVWGAKDIVHVKYRHVGQAFDRIDSALKNLTLETKPYNWTREIKVIDWMRKNKLGRDRDDVIDSVYKFREPALTQKLLAAAYNNAGNYGEIDEDPNTWYGMSNALTRFSQTNGNADKRHDIDLAVGRIFDRASKLVTV